MSKRIVLVYLLFFIVIETAMGLFLIDKYELRKAEYVKYAISDTKSKFRSAIHSFGVLSENFFYNHAESIAQYLALAEQADSEQVNNIRSAVLDEYTAFFNTQKLLRLDVLHIFDKEGNSFLRLHNPSKYGDPIYKQRFSLRQMRKEYTYQKGLELGVYREAFRFQFPLFYDGEFVGSYEYGMGFGAIAGEMQRQFGGDYLFLLKRSIVEKIMGKDVIAQRYGVANVDSNYFYLKGIQNSPEFSYGKRYLKNKTVESGLKNDQPFVSFSNEMNREDIVVFLPIFDISGQHVAYFLYRYSGTPLANDKQDLIFEYIIGTLLSLMLIWIIYYINKSRLYVRNMLDLQKEMIILTDGQEIRDVNQTLLDYFGLKDFNKFKKEHACVCDYFIEEEGYLSNSVSGLNWVDYIKTHQDKIHKVKMADSKGIVHIFKLEYGEFEDSSDNIITFQDITLAEEEYEKLEERASLDALTGIFNRERFNMYLAGEISRSERYNTVFSLVMFDIDHFKKINDTYGHDIGDEVLKSLTLLVKNEIRESDIFARWGGEEFMIITLNNLSSSERFAEKLRQSVEVNRFEKVGLLTCSFGVTQYRRNETFESLIKRCDNALYAAKHAERNCVVTIR